MIDLGSILAGGKNHDRYGVTTRNRECRPRPTSPCPTNLLSDHLPAVARSVDIRAMKMSGVSRLAEVLPEILPLIFHRQVQTTQMVSAGLRLGGMPAWTAEQVRFSPRLAEPSATDGLYASVKDIVQPSFSDVKIIKAVPEADTAIIAYSAISETGELLRVLTSEQSSRQVIISDGRILKAFLNAIPRSWCRIPRKECLRLIEDVTSIAMIETSLSEEINGLRFGVDSKYFDAPGILSHQEHLLVETELIGRRLQELPTMQRQSVYGEAVTRWSRMLIAGGVLQLGLRRDRLRVRDGGLGITRWAGTRQALPTSTALVQSLAQGVYGRTAPIRAANRHQVSELLADGIGLTGELGELEALCLSLISGDNSFEMRRWRLSEIPFRERTGYSRSTRVEVLLVLRQLMWLRDLGQKCYSEDLANPWRKLTVELKNT